MSIVCDKERFGCLITPASMSVIAVEGEVWMFDHSYSFVYCLHEGEVWLSKHSSSCISQLKFWLVSQIQENRGSSYLTVLVKV